MTTTTDTRDTIRKIWMACKNCKRVFQIGAGPTPCPDCGSPYYPTWTEPSNLALQEKLYGTTNNPVWNEGLGSYTTGKRSRRVEAAKRGLIPRDE